MTDKLKELDGQFRADVEDVLDDCRADGISMVPYFALRTPSEQARLWRQSRPASTISEAIARLRDQGAGFLADVLRDVGAQNGPHVTNALPGASWHQWGLAVDSYWEVNGDAEWSTTKKIGGKNGYRVYAEKAQNRGLTAGGFWSSLKDWPHIQKPSAGSPLKQGLSWAEIDHEMRKRFGSGAAINLLGPVPAPSVPALKLGYRSPLGWSTYYTDDKPAVLFRGRMTVCADGAPKAYHSDSSKALDFLGNAGRPGNWWAIVTDDGTASGNPITQTDNDPAPGFYVSMTAMSDPTFRREDPRRYVDATTIPFVVLPGVYRNFYPGAGPVLGDLGVAYNRESGLLSAAIFAEVGPSDELGEGSIELAKRLGLNHNAKNGGTSNRVVSYVVFPGTAGGVRPVKDIDARGAELFADWGGLGRLLEYDGV